MGMSDTQVHQFNPMFAVIENQILGKKNGRRLEPGGLQVRAILYGRLPSARFMSVIAGFVLFHFLNHARMRNRHPAVIYEDLISICMVAVMMCIKSKSNRLIS